MILVVLMICLIGAVAFYQIVQGVFSALIMMMLTIISAMVAFEYYMPMATKLLYDSQPAHAQGASLIAIFVITLLVLRIASDKLITGNVVMNVLPNRIGAGIAGVVTGVILIGVLGAGIQLLPVGESFFGFVSHDDTLQPNDTLVATDMTLSVIGSLSDGAMSGDVSWNRDNPNFTREAFCARNTAGKHGRVDAKTDAIRIMGIQRIDTPVKRTYVVRLAVSDQTRNSKDNCFRLPATQFRLVTTEGKSVYPRTYKVYGSISKPENEEKYLAEVTAEKTTGDDGEQRFAIGKLTAERKYGNSDLVIEWTFDLGKEYEEEGLDYITFRRTARANINMKKVTTAPLPALDPDGKVPKPTTQPTQPAKPPVAS